MTINEAVLRTLGKKMVERMLEIMNREDRTYYKTIRRLALASFSVRNKEYDFVTDIDLHADNDWARAEAVYKELIKIDNERCTHETDAIRDN